MLFTQRAYDKKDLFNLNEDEELTHFGQSLAEIEKFTDFVNSDDESEERGLLSGEIKPMTVSHQKSCLVIAIMMIFTHPAELTASHFGGGGGLLRKKTSGDQQEDDGSQRVKSRQELIEELILKSKQEKVSPNRASRLSFFALPCISFARILVNFHMFSGSDRHRKRKRRS